MVIFFLNIFDKIKYWLGVREKFELNKRFRKYFFRVNLNYLECFFWGSGILLICLKIYI